MSNIKRYQNPELFEQLAIEYAVGALQGRARKRFESLMETHFYLRAVVDAYEIKFASLVELLPDAQPSKKVWEGIDSHIKAQIKAAEPKKEKNAWWKSNFFKQAFSITMMTMVVSAVLLFNPNFYNNTATATSYTAIMETESADMVAVTKIDKSKMKLSIEIMKQMDLAKNTELTLWCHPKNGGKPMKMGTIAKMGKTEIKISMEEWLNMQNVARLEIKTPTGVIILKGNLKTND